MVQQTVTPLVYTPRSWVPPKLSHAIRTYDPKTHLGRLVREMALTYRIPSDAAEELIRAISGSVICESSLSATIMWADGRIEPLGEISRRLVTDVGVGYIIDAMQNIVESENMKYHSLGTGSTAEAAGDTALVTELTTEYTGNVRATGTTSEGAANVFSTVATNTLDGTPGAALREHGIHSASTAGVLFDRSVYAAITLVSGDGLQTTYTWTLAAGG